jgi:allantoinase
VILRSSRVVLPNGVQPAAIHLRDGRITAIDTVTVVGPDLGRPRGRSKVRPYIERADSGDRGELIDVGDLVVSPGIVDTHVHVNEPGRTEWEGFDTATRAAAAGGVTTIVDMPLNSVPATTTVAALEAKRSAARGRCHVDVAFWGGVVPGNAQDLEPLVDAGVRGFKCFLVPSGVDEFPCVDERDLRQAMPILARRGVPLLVHAESPALVGSPERLALQPSDVARGFQPSVYDTYLSTRPPAAEVDAIRLIVRLALEFGTRVHIVHVASDEAAREIAAAKANGVSITAETCPHYLTFAAEDVPDRATEFKCAPPIREARHREALWVALDAGVLDLIATDHSPAPPALKCSGDFMKAWGGIASLELSLAAVWTGASNHGGALSGPRAGGPQRTAARLVALARWFSAMPARLAALDDRKGCIAVGCDADLVVWDPEGERRIDAAALQQRHKLTPYAGRSLRGVVHATFVRGACAWHDGQVERERTGQLL